MAGRQTPKKAARALPHDAVSPLTHKRRRLEHDESQSSQPPPLAAAGTPEPTRFESSLAPPPDPFAGAIPMSGGIEFVPPSSLPTPSPYPTFGVASSLTPSVPSGLAISLARLETESHAVRLRQAKAVRDDSQTGDTYARQVARYQSWWESDQASRHAADAGYTVIPPFPVTAARVVMFLEYETTREKVSPLSPSPFQYASCHFILVPARQHKQDNPRINSREVSHLAGHQRPRELACQPPPLVQGQH
jgi:hypothetical protein